MHHRAAPSESPGIDRAALLGSTERVVHGTTVATNALLERKGAKLGLLTTEGHRDVLEMREGLKDDRYALRQPAPDPLVPRHLRLPVCERIRADGTSTDMSLVVEGEAAVSTDRRVAGHRVALHSLDIASIGAGGGSMRRRIGETTCRSASPVEYG